MQIPDSKASDHIVGSPTLLTILKVVKNKSIDLPDVSLANVTYVDQIVFFSILVLDNDLCVPIFHLDLAYISKLIHHSLCLTVFLVIFL